MNDNSTWAPEDVPQSFWDRIKEAGGDREKFRAIISDLSREELREMYDQYMSLAHQLFSDRHLAHMGEDVSEDAWMDVANWVVMQGEDFYWDVFEDPDKTPSREKVRGATFASDFVTVFSNRFGEWI